ncbi:MAG: twin-arginine translocase TatA/TatE family subunit [Betaproteobacteria bacterium]
MLGDIGLPELLVILAIVAVIFGANRLPELGKSLGTAIKGFKQGMNGEDS